MYSRDESVGGNDEDVESATASTRKDGEDDRYCFRLGSSWRLTILSFVTRRRRKGKSYDKDDPATAAHSSACDMTSSLKRYRSIVAVKANQP